MLFEKKNGVATDLVGRWGANVGLEKKKHFKNDYSDLISTNRPYPFQVAHYYLSKCEPCRIQQL